MAASTRRSSTESRNAPKSVAASPTRAIVPSMRSTQSTNAITNAPGTSAPWDSHRIEPSDATAAPKTVTWLGVKPTPSSICAVRCRQRVLSFPK